jgi:hypothetical protein
MAYFGDSDEFLVILAALGAGGVMAEVDLILI